MIYSSGDHDTLSVSTDLTRFMKLHWRSKWLTACGHWLSINGGRWMTALRLTSRSLET